MPEPSSVRSLITPQDQTLRTVFNAQRSYLIDIYQREYKWTEENVRTLLLILIKLYRVLKKVEENPRHPPLTGPLFGCHTGSLLDCHFQSGLAG